MCGSERVLGIILRNVLLVDDARPFVDNDGTCLYSLPPLV